MRRLSIQSIYSEETPPVSWLSVCVAPVFMSEHDTLDQLHLFIVGRISKILKTSFHHSLFSVGLFDVGTRIDTRNMFVDSVRHGARSAIFIDNVSHHCWFVNPFEIRHHSHQIFRVWRRFRGNQSARYFIGLKSADMICINPDNKICLVRIDKAVRNGVNISIIGGLEGTQVSDFQQRDHGPNGKCQRMALCRGNPDDASKRIARIARKALGRKIPIDIVHTIRAFYLIHGVFVPSSRELTAKWKPEVGLERMDIVKVMYSSLPQGIPFIKPAYSKHAWFDQAVRIWMRLAKCG